MRHRQLKSLLIITDHAAQAIAQRLDRLQHAAFQGLVIGGQQGDHVHDQAELQFPGHVQRVVALLGLERINGEKETLATEVGLVLGETQRISTTQQYEKDTDEVQDFTLRDGQATFLGEDFMDLCHGPAFPEPPVANLDNHFQSKTTAAHGQAAGRLRGVDPLMPGAFRMGTTIAHANHQVSAIQKDHVFSPERITTLQDTSTTRASGLFRPIVTFGNFAIIFGSSHRHTSLTRGSWKN